jgi:hypothetical protein
LEIEADFLERGIDIQDWWRRSRRPDGTLVLSSRRLEALVLKLPDNSAFRKEWREQDWSLAQYMDAAMVNELRIMRAELGVYNNRDFREPILVKSPSQGEEDAVEAAKKHALVASIQAQLRGAKRPEDQNKTE